MPSESQAPAGVTPSADPGARFDALRADLVALLERVRAESWAAGYAAAEAALAAQASLPTDRGDTNRDALGTPPRVTHARFTDEIAAVQAARAWLEPLARTYRERASAVDLRPQILERGARGVLSLWVDMSLAAYAVILRDELGRLVLLCGECGASAISTGFCASDLEAAGATTQSRR